MLLDGCSHVYVDVGTNIGVQVRKLFEPQPYARAPVQKLFDRYYGATATDRRAVCAVGLEPNPHHASRLHDLQQRYSALGWRFELLRAAASNDDGNATFFFDVSCDP